MGLFITDRYEIFHTLPEVMVFIQDHLDPREHEYYIVQSEAGELNQEATYRELRLRFPKGNYPELISDIKR